MTVLRNCQIPEWKKRALKHAHSLKGRENTKVEQDFLDTHPDHWDFFYVFGIDETRQGYIDVTIRQIEKCKDLSQYVTCILRLKWSTLALKKS